MLANLATSILDKGRVKTTVQKAKLVRGVVERLITYAKRGGLHNIRLAHEVVKDKDVLKKLFAEIAQRFTGREGGYIRIMRTTVRKGDNAELCFIELVGPADVDVKRKRKGKKKPAQRRTKKAMVPAAEATPEQAAPADAAKPAETAAPAPEEKKES